MTAEIGTKINSLSWVYFQAINHNCRELTAFQRDSIEWIIMNEILISEWWLNEFNQFLEKEPYWGVYSKNSGIKFIKSRTRSEINEFFTVFLSPMYYPVEPSADECRINPDSFEWENSEPWSFTIYGYDIIGRPPFDLPESLNSFEIKNATTLKRIPDWFPKKIIHLFISKCGIESFENSHKIFKSVHNIFITDCPNIRSHILSLFVIPASKENDNTKRISIKDCFFSSKLNDILPSASATPMAACYYNDSDAFELQAKLIDAGFTELAKL